MSSQRHCQSRVGAATINHRMLKGTYLTPTFPASVLRPHLRAAAHGHAHLAPRQGWL